MKVSEFEFKLTTVSDAKLLQMLSVCRRDGPDIALNLLETEAKKRGREESQKALVPLVESPDPSIESDSQESISSLSESEEEGIVAAAEQAVGYSGGTSIDPHPSQVPALFDDAPPHSDWLEEESSSSKVPIATKVLLFVVGLGALFFTAYKLLHRS